MSAVPTTPAQTAAESVAFPRVLARSLALPLIFVAATAYHFLQSRGHATTTVFNDELLYAKLSQSIAAGHGLAIRGEPFFFPAPFALLTAAAAVATPAMFYHGYLMSEALAYPVFLLTLAVLARALAGRSNRLALEVPAVCLLAIATRVQFLVLPLAYLVGVAVCGRGAYRRHLVPAALTALLVTALVGLPGVLGQYGQASTQVGHAPGALAQWALTDGILLAYGLGLVVVPAALFGLALMLARPRAPMERAVAVLTVVCTAFFLGQSSLIAAGEAQRPLERYLFYVTPLVFLAFFAYAERGAPRRFLCSGLGCIGALLLAGVSLPGMTGTAALFFDAPTLTGFARAAYYLGFPNASLLYTALPLALALLAFMLPLTRRGVPQFFALVAIAVMGAAGAAVYATDRLATEWDAQTFGADPQDWLDRSGLGPARYLSLPKSNDFFGTQVESWNRDLQGIVVLGKPATDPYPVEAAHVATDGRLVIDGRPTRSEVLVVNVNGSAIDLEGRVVASPREDIVAYRVPADAHVRSLAQGLSPDGWARERLEYRVWPQGAGRYELTLSLPKGTPPRKATLTAGGEKRTVTRRATTRVRLSIPTSGAPLKLAVEVPGAALGGRILGAQVIALRFVRT